MARGANKIVVDYDDALPTSLTFQLLHRNQPLLFNLPANVQDVHECLIRQKVGKKYQTKEQAARTAWRIIKVWIEAQMAIIDAEIVTPTQVFLPYAVTKNGNTLYDEIDNTNILLIQ